MRPRFQERHFDYVLGPNQDARLASVAPGAVVSGITLQLDHDAPFQLRGRAYRVKYNTASSRTQPGLNGLSMRYSGPLRDFRQQTYIPQNLVMPYGGQGGAWLGLRHQVAYPAGGVIQVDLVNTGASELTNLTFYWRGVKLYEWGTNPGYTYPQDCRVMPFVYPIAERTTANPLGIILGLGTSETRLSQIFRCDNDADFVLRYGQAAPLFPLSSVGGSLVEVSFILRDENQKAYSNDFVHYETLFGPCQGVFNCGGTVMPAVGTGNTLPSIFYPEIYVRKNHILWWDVKRDDASFAGASAASKFTVNLVGSKVYSS